MPRKKNTEGNDEKPKATRRKKKDNEQILQETNIENVENTTTKETDLEKKEEEVNKVVEEVSQVVEEPSKVVEEPNKVVEEVSQVVEEVSQVVEEPSKVVEEPSKVVHYEEEQSNEVKDFSIEIKSDEISKIIEEDNIIKLNKTVSYKNLNEQLNISKINLLNNNENNEKEVKEFILDNNALNNILEQSIIDNIIDVENNYSLSDLENIFKSLKDACMIIDIHDGNIKYIEKKGNESRNQSVLDLLIKANNYKLLPNVQFVIFTNDFIDVNNLKKYPYLLTFCRNHYYKTNLFPNFNFNHWLEANIGSYEELYNYFIDNQLEWSNKSDMIFWSGANTNPIRQKISDSSKKYKNYFINILDKSRSNNISIKSIVKSKYLLNMNGYSYGGRLNYLFLSGSCVIILKNMNEDKCYEEYFYKEFIPNVDYIEILYSDNENGDIIINRINDAIKNNNCENIAKNCYLKAKNIFKMTNVYEYIHDILNYLSTKNIISNRLEHNLFFTPPLNYFFKERLSINDNVINFNFKGNDFEMNILDTKSTINIKIKNNVTKILYNNDIILEKYTPYIVNNNKIQKYKISIEKNNFSILLNDQFKLVNFLLPEDSFNGNNVEIKTDSEALWII